MLGEGDGHGGRVGPLVAGTKADAPGDDDGFGDGDGEGLGEGDGLGEGEALAAGEPLAAGDVDGDVDGEMQSGTTSRRPIGSVLIRMNWRPSGALVTVIVPVSPAGPGPPGRLPSSAGRS